MHKRTWFSLIPTVLVAAAVVSTLVAAPRIVHAPAPVDGPLHEAMESMNSAMRVFSKGVDAANRDKALESVAKLQAATLIAKLEKPAEAAKVDESKRAEFVSDYRKMMAEVLLASAELEIALIDNKFDVANALVKDKLMRLKNDGHELYQGEEEKH